MGEEGGLNLFGMVGNDAINLFDFLGLEKPGQPFDTSAPPPLPGTWIWVRDPGNSRAGRWQCGDIHGNWDARYNHWDMWDNRTGFRCRYDRHGTLLEKDAAHIYNGPKQQPISKKCRGVVGARNAKTLAVLTLITMVVDHAEGAIAKREAAWTEAEINKAYDDCIARAERLNATTGKEECCGYCMITLLFHWSNPGRVPDWFDRITGSELDVQKPSGFVTRVDGYGIFKVENSGHDRVLVDPLKTTIKHLTYEY